ncbi:A24 family peptidase [Cupriavidus agavae]|uniref:Prepilin peptidase CpaA n=1 Tax=Cupriavidus agavae TaxID=1001822 RepID=A0A4Q7RZU3_9BURK|nr:prepilin peptidase [Cupriavidus agavae]RZT39394.1 prepilin peptidase CpaA [Cupriavidus agavae]
MILNTVLAICVVSGVLHEPSLSVARGAAGVPRKATLMAVPLTFAAVVLPPVLVWVVFSDLLYRRIANHLVLALLAGWALHLGWMAWHDAGPLPWPAIGRGAAAAGIVLVLGYGLFAMRWVGAGDVKLVAVLCLWLGNEVSAFLVVTSLAGGVLALGMPVLRATELFLARRVEQLGGWLRRPFPTPMALRSHALSGIPYGFAIAAGAAFVLYRG